MEALVMESDVKLLRPIMRAYMRSFDYDYDDWELDLPQVIEPAHCSEYVIRVLGDGRKAMGLGPIRI